MSKLKPTIEHLSDADCRKLCSELVSCVQALGPLSSTDVTSELVDTLDKHGIEWDHDKVPEFCKGARVCLAAAHMQRGTVVKPGLKRTRVRWDDDDSVQWQPTDELELYE